MINSISEILSKCDSGQRNINPTLLYNEGWMIRLLVAESIKENITIKGLNFNNIATWYSEGLLSSPFLPRIKGDKLAEGFTHADMVLGDFTVEAELRGDIKLKDNANLFGVIEAKMGSKLSSGTKNAPNYNQASRNLACIAYNTLNSNAETFLAVVAPDKKIVEHGIEKIVKIDYMLNQINDRFEQYLNEYGDVYSFKEQILDRAAKCQCMVVSYENWISEFSDQETAEKLQSFLELCYKYNRI